MQLLFTITSKPNFFVLIFFMMPCINVSAQSYQALNGSPQAGGMAVINNPAAALYVPFAWDITPFSIHVKHTTNFIAVKNYPLFSSGANSEIEGAPGTKKRHAMANQEIRLLNTRIRLNKNNAIAFGAVVRSYVSATTSALTLKNRFRSFYEFLDLNYGNIPVSGRARASAWAEVYATWARNIINNDNAIVNGGVTLKVNRSLAGGWMNLDNTNYTGSDVNDRPAYLLQSGKIQYGYSSGIDVLNGTASGKLSRFLQQSSTGISANLGMEYILPVEKEGDEKNEYNYDLKIGLSLLDVGFNRYAYSPNSKSAVYTRKDVSDSLLELTFSDIQRLDDVDDSLAAIASPLNTLSGNFDIIQPTRLVINADKYISDNFFINAEITVPVTALAGSGRLVLKDMNLLAVTPRYETKTLGVYLPITINTQRQCWVGGALKMGPLLMGIHNWANLFSKNKIHRGGGYVALTFRPGKNHSSEKEKLTKEQKQQLSKMDCPKF